MKGFLPRIRFGRLFAKRRDSTKWKRCDYCTQYTDAKNRFVMDGMLLTACPEHREQVIKLHARDRVEVRG